MSQDNVVWQEAYHTLKEYLGNKENVIFDSTACSTRTQKALENMAKSFEAIILYKIFEVSVEEATKRVLDDIERGVDRSKVPVEIIEKMGENFVVAKERVQEEAKNLNVFMIHEHYKDVEYTKEIY